MSDIIFWYTGATAWSIASLLFLLLSVYYIYQGAKNTTEWIGIHKLLGLTKEDQAAVFKAARVMDFDIDEGQFFRMLRKAAAVAYKHHYRCDVKKAIRDKFNGKNIDCGDQVIYRGSDARVVSKSGPFGYCEFDIRILDSDKLVLHVLACDIELKEASQDDE